MSEIKERVTWIDSAKGILIITVILGHSLVETSYESPFYHGYILALRLITLFHMPAFFILSGYLMGKNKGQKSTPIYVYIKRKLIKLMVPYLIFEGMATVLLVFVASCAFFIITKINDSRPALLLIAVPLSIAMVCFCNRESHSGLLVGRSLIALCFMAIGYLWVGNEKHIAIINRPLYLIFIVLAMTAIAILNGPVSMYEIMMGKSKIMFVVGAIFGTLLIICISQLKTSSIFKKIGLNSLVIMGVHQHVVYVSRRLNISIYGIIPTMLLFASMLIYSLTIASGYSFIRNYVNSERYKE